MTTHNLIIYHCLACGAIMHCEPDEEAPQCCGRPMIKAAAETVGQSEGAIPKAVEPKRSVDRIPPKPR